MPSWRILVHALDRTGPPMLARALVRWIRSNRPADAVQVVAFRGGDLISDMATTSPVEVVLEPSEPWDHDRPAAERVRELQERLRSIPTADATLLVSVSAGQALDLLGSGGPIVTWVVEQGEDLHWLDPPLNITGRTDLWLAGSDGTRSELLQRLADSHPGRPGPPEVHIAPEFIEDQGVDPDVAATCRAELVGNEEHLVIGAGIGTYRKAPDLFVEIALAWHRRQTGSARFIWLGGEADPMIPLLRSEVSRLGLEFVRFVDSVPEIDTWLAAADVFLHPARLDAFPLVCLHAAFAETPVVAFSNRAGMEEMFGPSFVGAGYPDVNTMADQVQRMLTPDAGTVASAQHERVTSRFSSEAAAPILYEHLRTAAALGTTR